MEHKRMPPPYIEEVKEFIKKETLIVITSPGCTCKPLYLRDAGKVEKLGDSDDCDWSLKKLQLERGIFTEKKKIWAIIKHDWQFIREDLKLGIEEEIRYQYVLIFSCRKIQ